MIIPQELKLLSAYLTPWGEGGREGCKNGFPSMLFFLVLDHSYSFSFFSCDCNDGLWRKDHSNQVVLAALRKPRGKRERERWRGDEGRREGGREGWSVM